MQLVYLDHVHDVIIEIIGFRCCSNLRLRFALWFSLFCSTFLLSYGLYQGFEYYILIYQLAFNYIFSYRFFSSCSRDHNIYTKHLIVYLKWPLYHFSEMKWNIKAVCSSLVSFYDVVASICHLHACSVTKSSASLCDPMDCSPPGSCPWNSPGKNTLPFPSPEGVFPTQGLNLHLLHCRQILYLRTTREVHFNIYVR